MVAGAPLPAGWAGKPWALEQGLRAARGEWVVFLDADTRPQPGLIAALVEARGAFDLVSAGPRFVVRDGLGERAAPVVPDDASSTASARRARGSRVRARAIINGQCVALRRETLLDAGGWALVRRA